jgi:iron complex transport system substrate-binding protein
VRFIQRRDAESQRAPRKGSRLSLRLCISAVNSVVVLLCFSAVNLAAAPRRIVSTSPSITEMLYALGLGDRVVGVTTFCHYPPEAMKKPKIGSYLAPSVEAIVALRPDLVISEKTGVRRPERLPGLKLNVLAVDDGTLAGIYDSIRKIGAAASVPERAESLCRDIAVSLEAIRKRVAGLPRRRMVFVIGRTPGRLEGLVAVGPGPFLNELIEIAGGENIFRDAAAAYAKVTLEEVLARNPEAIVDMGEMSVTTGVTEPQKRAVVALWSRYPNLAAVKRRAVFAVASDIFVVPGPRVVEAARAFAQMLHPEARW